MKFDKKVLISIMLGIVISVMTNVIAESFEKDSKNIYYKDNSNLLADNVQDAIDGTCTKFEEKIDNFLDKIYPVGSVYITTTLETPEKVKEALGGKWESYGQGRTLVGVGNNGTSNYKAGVEGGSETTTLTVDNLPSHTHDISHTHKTVETTTKTMSLTALESGLHSHGFTGGNNGTRALVVSSVGTDVSVTFGFAFNQDGGAWSNQTKSSAYIESSGSHTHNVTGTITIPELTTAAETLVSGETGKDTSFNIQDPYITVYMYKRIE